MVPRLHYFLNVRQRRSNPETLFIYIVSKEKKMQQTQDVPQPPKKDSFRKYLDDGGVIDSLARTIVELYENQRLPADLNEYIKEKVGLPRGVNVESLKAENESLKEEQERLQKRLHDLKTQLGISD